MTSAINWLRQRSIGIAEFEGLHLHAVNHSSGYRITIRHCKSASPVRSFAWKRQEWTETKRLAERIASQILQRQVPALDWTETATGS